MNTALEGYVRVSNVEEISTRRGLPVDIDGIAVALFQVEGNIVAVQNDCPHQHFSLLHQGEVSGGTVRCPMHGWTFDLRTGHARIGSGRLQQYDVKIVGDEVWVKRPTSPNA